MIIVIGRVCVRPEALQTAITLSREHCARSRAEGGCLSHHVSQDCDDPYRLTFVEHWADIGALKTHFALKQSQDFVAALTKTLAKAPEMKIYAADVLSLS